MKKGSVLIIVLTVVNMILAVAFLFLGLQMDRTPPVLKFQTSEYIFASSDSKSRLLDNIIAIDDVDGNITDHIVIEKIIEKKEDSSIIVFYAVSDRAGNVAKISRIFPALFEDEEQREDSVEEAQIKTVAMQGVK